MKKIIFNLNFDDFHPQNSKYGDFGGNKEGLFSYINELITEYPKIKITMFTVPNWIDKPDDLLVIKGIKYLLGLNFNNSWKGEPFRIDKHPEWVEWVNEYVKKGNLEIAIHGLYHHKDNTFRHSAEFEGLEYDECLTRLRKAEEIMKEAGLKYVRGFRPPGWGISGGLLKALKDLKFEFVSLFGTPYKLTNIFEIEGLVNIPQNYSILEPAEEGLRIAQKYGKVYAKGHYSPRNGREIIPNGLTKENFNNLKTLLERLSENYKLRFLSMKEIAKEYKRGRLR